MVRRPTGRAQRPRCRSGAVGRTLLALAGAAIAGCACISRSNAELQASFVGFAPLVPGPRAGAGGRAGVARRATQKFEVGQKCRGRVTSILPFGAFVDIGAEKDGMVHVSRMSEQRVENARDFLTEGQEVDVWVSHIEDGGKLGLTMIPKRVGGGGRGEPPVQDLAPFEAVAANKWIEGKVVRIATFGLIIEAVAPNGVKAEGLVHVSEIKDGIVENTNYEAAVGQEVNVRVLSVDTGAGRLALSMKPMKPIKEERGGGGRAAARITPDFGSFVGISSDKWLKGKVARTANFGIFVTLTNKDGKIGEGLVHISKIRDGVVKDVAEEVQVGQEVDVRILSVDVAAGKMLLSMMKR